MCGIFGYAGRMDDAAGIVLRGLKQLEYRGYDSWGVSVGHGGRAVLEKQTGKKPVTARPADLLEPGLEMNRRQCTEKGLPSDDETVVLFAMFPQQVEALVKPKTPAAAPAAAATAPSSAASAAPASSAPRPASGNGARKMFVTVNGKRHDVTVETVA